jgi:hypothetical protein
MTTFPNSPKLLKGGIVLIDPETAHVKRIISLQYNPESLSRTLQVQGFGESGDRSETLWLGSLPLRKVEFDERFAVVHHIDVERSSTE